MRPPHTCCRAAPPALPAWSCLPRLSSRHQNFEQYEDEGGSGLTPGGSRSRPIADPNFIGYTYKNWDVVHSAQGGCTRREGAGRVGSGWGSGARLGGRVGCLAVRCGMDACWLRCGGSHRPACVLLLGSFDCSKAAGQGAARQAGTAQHQRAGGGL